MIITTTNVWKPSLTHVERVSVHTCETLLVCVDYMHVSAGAYITRALVCA